jgi:TrmH family RNA methyltransferase
LGSDNEGVVAPTPAAQGDLTPSLHLSNVVVILVEPSDARNIGAVARAMSNLGFPSLRLVAPIDYRKDVAEKVACWGQEVLTTAVNFPSLREATADLHEVVGFSSLYFKHRAPAEPLKKWVASQPITATRRLGLIFGPEDSGLRKEHLPLCQALVRIPSVSENRSFNLGQAVLLVLFSLRQSEAEISPHPSEPLAPLAQVDVLERTLTRVSQISGYTDATTRPHIPELLANLARRTRPTVPELQVLIGLFGRLERALLEKVPINPLEE